MSRIELAPELVEDLDRIVDHLLAHTVDDPASRVEQIIQAIDVLQHNPLIGRAVRGLNRELVTGRGSRGYVALYRYVVEIDTVFVLAIRGQAEAGYSDE